MEVKLASCMYQQNVKIKSNSQISLGEKSIERNVICHVTKFLFSKHSDELNESSSQWLCA